MEFEFKKKVYFPLEDELSVERWKRDIQKYFNLIGLDDEIITLENSSTEEFINEFKKYLNNNLDCEDIWYDICEMALYMKLIGGTFVNDIVNELKSRVHYHEDY